MAGRFFEARTQFMRYYDGGGVTGGGGLPIETPTQSIQRMLDSMPPMPGMPTPFGLDVKINSLAAKPTITPELLVNDVTQLNGYLTQLGLNLSPSYMARLMVESYIDTVTAPTPAGVTDEQERQDMLDLVLTQTLRGRPVPDTFPKPTETKLNTAMTYIRNLMAYYVHSPEYVQALVNNEIIGVHASTSGSLLGVLDHGLLPQQEIEARGLLVTTGEGVYSGAGFNATSVSFVQPDRIHRLKSYYGNADPLTADIVAQQVAAYDAALQAVNPMDVTRPSLEKKVRQLQALETFLRTPPADPLMALQQDLIQQNFPVIYYVSQNTQRPRTFLSLGGLDTEFGLEGGAEREHMPMISVPANRVDFVRSLIAQGGLTMEVFPIEIVD